MNLRELRQQRTRLLSQAREIVDKAQAASRDLTDEERTTYDDLISQIDTLNGDISRLEALEGYEAEGQRSVGRLVPGEVVSGQGPAIGLSRRDLRRYSLVRAIRAAASGDWREAQFERECSEEIARLVGRTPQGFFVPYEWQVERRERRDLAVGTPSAGGYLVATDLLEQSFIELMRNRMVVQAAGARVLSGLVGDVDIPKQSGGATAYWVGEGSDVTESQQTLGQVALTPKTVGAFTDVTRKLLRQSSIDVEGFLREDLATVLALAIDLAALHGSGSGNEPTGVANTSGIGLVVGGTDGAAPTWDHIVALETEVAQDNADVGRLAYISNPKVRGKLKSTPRTATYGDIMIWEPTAGSTPVNGYPFFVSNQVASNLTKGSSVGVCSAIFFGNWSDLLIGMWGVLDILVDPYTLSKSGGVRVVALQDVDIAVRHAESFAAMLDALTT